MPIRDGIPVEIATRRAIRFATALGIGWLWADRLVEDFDFETSAERRGSKGRELRRSAMGLRGLVQRAQPRIPSLEIRSL